VIPRGLVRRAAALAAVALVGVLLALTAGSFATADEKSESLPKPVPVPGAGWYRALAAPYPASSRRERTACGQQLGQNTLGVAHPVLPCGVKIFIAYNDKTVLTQVVDRGPSAPGRQFDITRPLARKLGLAGTQQIRWRYAR
jgi:hypothetical protein